MTKIIIIILMLVIWLTSCWMTQEEKLKKIEECKEIWLWYWLDWVGEIQCDSTVENRVFNCIREYTRWLDEKYNNPDTVSDLREDEFSKVVKTCNEVFWNNNSLSK